MNWFRTILVSTVLALGFSAVAGHAAPPVAQPAKSTYPAITDIGEMLKSLGYTIEPNKDRSGTVDSYWTNVKVGNLSIDVLVEMSPNQNTVWFTIPLVNVKDTATLTPQMLVALLKANASANGMITFVMTPENQLVLETWQHADGLTEAKLKTAILALIQQAVDTSDVWLQAK